ncbi:SRPBCC family protein [Portibacter marinus]|uniref:SRPBCC family protein n=1 Tax=Portibacter marinus TaxID=2898660 RepID=UPI001F3A1FE8|nr:SRPBCC family protein [Portibacter marinus]
MTNIYFSMPTIQLTTHINSPIEIVFNLSRSVDLHQISTSQTDEKVIGGLTAGLMELHDTVTWRAKHFGFYQTLTSKITAMDKYSYFTDEMEKGIFKSFKHIHRFKETKNYTIMNDEFEYKSPLGILGKFADILFLKKYMQQFLIIRNNTIKYYAESGRYKEILKLKTDGNTL